MPSGGKRLGAGRKRGGKNRRTSEVAMKAAEAGVTPVEHMLSVMRDASQPDSVRLQAAGMVAPYVHPRLAHIHTSRTPRPDILKNLYERVMANDAEKAAKVDRAITLDTSVSVVSS